MIKSSVHVIKGMQRDLTVSKFNPEFAFDAQNIRITARENNSLLSITNEKGNKPIKDKEEKDITIQGTIIGYNVLNKYLTLFTTGAIDGRDYIYRLEKKEGYFESIPLYAGHLKFDTKHPIESIGIYETAEIQKVYWVDGKNQPRVINIVAHDVVWHDTSFDFVQELKLEEEITVERNNVSSGIFAPGVIQYAFSYYNIYGQESNIFYTTPLQYISFNNRGASPEDKVSCSFTITVKHLDNFDYLRIYSIHRTSIDETPTVTIVSDIKLNGSSKVEYVDNGTHGSTTDPTELLYIGGETIIPYTMVHKDNTLFLGNIQLEKKIVSDIINPDLNSDTRDADFIIGFDKKEDIDITGSESGYYPYKNNLDKGASQITTFHSKEWYRFGLQFQYKTGKWSEPIFINDAQVTRNPVQEFIRDISYAQLTKATFTINKKIEDKYKIIEKAVEKEFIKVRGVVVYPSISDREVIAQGILCPTVYNLNDRFTNSPYVQASWFSRPSLGVAYNNKNSVSHEDKGGDVPYEAIINNDDNPEETPLFNGKEIISRGVWAEFRHNSPIPDNWKRNAEIQCIANAPDTPYLEYSEKNPTANLNAWIANRSEYFFVDQSVVTMHSPEFEFDDNVNNMDLSPLKLRIVGRVPFTANATDIDIQTSTPPKNTLWGEILKETIGVQNIDVFGSRSLLTGAYYKDSAYISNDLTHDLDHYAFFVYPWHRNGSLNNQSNDGESRTAMLKYKKMSNLKFSICTEYMDTPWNADGNDWNEDGNKDDEYTGISGAVLFNSDEDTLIKIPKPKNSTLGDINYYGNIDKVVTPTIMDDEYNNPLPTTEGHLQKANRKNGYPIIIGGYGKQDTNNPDSFSEYNHSLFVGGPRLIADIKSTITGYGRDPVRITYKSTPHAVIALNYTEDGKQAVLPTTTFSYNGVIYPKNDVSKDFFKDSATGLWDFKMPWDLNCTGVYQGSFYCPSNGFNNYGYLWLGELYNDSVRLRFGGKTSEAIENNVWLPAGKPVSIIKGYDSKGKPIPKTIDDLNSIKIEYTEGDTYYQRYDCLKTYPRTLEDQNSIVDIVSFMCETRINIDGRYDRNRGQTSNLAIRPENFNKINNVYSQENNFFSYRALNPKRYTNDYFPNTITWTKEKSAGELVDTWTNITMATPLDLDGDKGEIVSLNRFNNELYCFQKRGISNILFNSRVQVPTSDGMPIEISNGLKVNGKRYISNTIGCNNKWSIAESPSGLYFIDNITNSIYLFNGQISSLSDKLGFRQWVGENNSLDNWDPVEFKNFVTYYDKNNDDVYFVNKDTALVYSELLGQFTSFMSYGQVPGMFNIDSDFYAIKNGMIWEQFAGDYNKIFNEYCPYSVTFISNADEPYDKIFNTVEFRADCWSKDDLGNKVLESGHTFDTLEVWNEYQKGVSSLTCLKSRPSPLKKKFRVWRANVPRANTDWNGVPAENKMDRIRNTWAYVKLSMNKENTDRMEFHDMIVHYFV